MASGVTEQALKRLSHIPNSDNPADLIAGQTYDDVEFIGGTISGITPTDLPTPLAIEDGGTGQITANAALNALLPDQSTHTGEVLKTDGTDTYWSADIDTGITQLTGDVTAGPGSGSQAATLATVNSNVGPFGSSTSIPSFTVNAKGLITAASGNVVIAPAGTLTGATLASNVLASSLTSVGTLSSLTLGGTLAMGANNITSTGSLGATGSRLTAGFFTDLTVTNAISGSITGNAATVSSANEATDTTCFPLFITASGTQTLQPKNNTSLTFNSNTGALAATSISESGTAATGTGGLVRATSPTLVTPTLGAASATSVTFSSTTGIVGTNTNNNAAAGSVGEYVSSTVLVGSAVSLTTGVDANITSISLTAGDWDVWGTVALASGGSATRLIGWISSTSASLPTIPNDGAYQDIPFSGTTATIVYSVGRARFSLSGTTTVYLSCEAAFASTRTAYGFIGARRVR